MKVVHSEPNLKAIKKLAAAGFEPATKGIRIS
jgi:hypothetical protein